MRDGECISQRDIYVVGTYVYNLDVRIQQICWDLVQIVAGFELQIHLFCERNLFSFSFRTQQSEFMLSERYISTCTASICINIILYDKDMRIRKYFI